MRPLNIAGLHRSSLIDFPKKIASVVFTQGCNLRCPWCHNSRLVPAQLSEESADFDPEKCLAFIKSRSDLMDGVVITGGEPLLQPSLGGFIQAIKEMGLLVKLDTNGTLPSRLKKFLDADLIDYVAMDIKAPLECAGAYCVAAGGMVDTSSIQKSATYIADLAPAGEFRTTILPGFHTFEMLKEMVEELPASVPYYLQIFIPEHARSGYWTKQPRDNPDSIHELVDKLRSAFPERHIEARA